MHWYKVSYLEEFPRSSKLPVMANRTFLQEQSVVTMEQSLISSS